MNSFYFWATYRRKEIDHLQNLHKDLYKGVVLDIGGRDIGNFKKPKNKVKKWIFADINKEHNPDIILNVENMKEIKNNSIDTITCLELFEHVQNPTKGLKECYRVLKPKGDFIMSIPFMFFIHADPQDFQRWTKTKIKMELEKTGFKSIYIYSTGGFWSTMFDMIRIRNRTNPLRYIGYLFYPLMDLIVSLEDESSNFCNGYYVVAKK